MRGSIKRDFPKFLTSDNRREKDEGKFGVWESSNSHLIPLTEKLKQRSHFSLFLCSLLLRAKSIFTHS